MKGHRRKRRGSRKFWFFFRLQLVLQVLILCTLFFYVQYWDTVLYYAELVKGLHEEAIALTEDASEEDFGVNRTNIAGAAYALDGTPIAVWSNGRDTCYVPIEEMPQAVVDAMICTEDKRFNEHKGVDYKALFRAFFALVKNKGKITQGGSTITMQLARITYLTQDVIWQRKVEEIFVAWQLEKIFTKDQIMEFYLNNICFGNGYYGIGNAARGYFGKDVWELDLAQLIYLCAIPNNPTIYDPLTNSANTVQRKERILKQMLDDGYISEEDCQEAASEEIVLKEPEEIERIDYVQSYAAHCAVLALMENSGFAFQYDFPDDAQRAAYEEEYAKCYDACEQLLYSEGYQVYTSLDLELQRNLQTAVDSGLRADTEKNQNGVYAFQGAAVCVDNETGYVRAIVGGRSQNFEYNTLNRAYQSFRQPGSAIKPLIVYTPAFERGYTPDTVVVDEPIRDGPRNATGHYEGEITVRHAVEQSVNTIAWKLFEELTPQTGLSYLKEMEFSKIVPQDYDIPSALGGFTLGVSPLEMASAFAAIENDGVFRSPTCVMRIVDGEGNIIYEADRSGKRVYTKEAADTMEDVLAGVMENGTGSPVRLENTFCAGKTGTTNDCKDSWFVGYTERYTTSVWVGYDMPREMEGLSGPAYSGYIWKDFMETINGQM